MELAALVGLIVGIGLLFWAMISGGSLATFWDPASLRIVLGGTIAAVAISHGGRQLRRIPGLVLKAFRRSNSNVLGLRDQLVMLAERARREGLLSLEDAIEDLEDPFLADAVQMLVDAVPPEQMLELLKNRIESAAEHNQRGVAVFRTAGAVSPAFGMIGTLIGLIQMLRDLENPEMIGSGMAIALITTLYGTLMANIIFTPVANKLEEWNQDELLVRNMALECIMAIQEGQNPRLIRSRLDSFVNGDKPDNLDDEERGDADSDASEEERIASDD